jgi:hypothetical protein
MSSILLHIEVLEEGYALSCDIRQGKQRQEDGKE